MTLLFITQVAWAQMEWREYPSMERGWYRDADIDYGYQEPGEFVVGRLMFPQARRGRALGVGGKCVYSTGRQLCGLCFDALRVKNSRNSA